MLLVTNLYTVGAVTTGKLISRTNSKHSAHHFGAEAITRLIFKLEAQHFACK